MTFEERIRLENAILVQDGFAQFRVYWYQQTGAYFLFGEHKTNSQRLYKLYSQIPSAYPYEHPKIYVSDPNPLWGYMNSRTINSYGVSHQMHTMGNGPNNEVQICHWRSDRWHSGITLNRVVIKVILWLEAYEQHLSTGQPISDFVRSMAQA